MYGEISVALFHDAYPSSYPSHFCASRQPFKLSSYERKMHYRYTLELVLSDEQGNRGSRQGEYE